MTREATLNSPILISKTLLRAVPCAITIFPTVMFGLLETNIVLSSLADPGQARRTNVQMARAVGYCMLHPLQLGDLVALDLVVAAE